MAGTAIGQVIDWCVAGFTAAIASLDPTCAVADNWPAVIADGYLVVGHRAPDSGHAGDGQNAWSELGGMRIEETFSIPCYIDVFRPGPSQKPARDAAIAIYNAAVKVLLTDPTCGGVLTRGRVAIATEISLTQTVDAADTGENGLLRRALLSFELACKNTYTP